MSVDTTGRCPWRWPRCARELQAMEDGYVLVHVLEAEHASRGGMSMLSLKFVSGCVC